MTSTLIGSAAPKVGDLVTNTNPAGEVLHGLITYVTRDGSYYVRVGGPKGPHRTWLPGSVEWTTETHAARTLTVGQAVYTRCAGDWAAAEVVAVRRTRVTVRRTTKAGTVREFTVPAWAALRFAW